MVIFEVFGKKRVGCDVFQGANLNGFQ